MSRNLISVALLRRNSGGKGRGMILSMMKGVRAPVEKQRVCRGHQSVECPRVYTSEKIRILRDLRLGSAF